jgi:hypothetical protein
MIILYAIIGILFFCYSYTQVDLGMTLSRVSIWQGIQKQFQHIGFFNRPLSTVLFVFLAGAYFTMYAWVLWAIQKKRISSKTVWSIVLITAGALVFSYPAFSYDIFNHMFTAKTVLIYHQNPYIVTPLQFAGVDSWLSFMHWTHVTSIYSPLWIIMTLFPYIFGFGYFLFLLWNFKILVVLFYLLAVWSIGKILEKDGLIAQLTGIALFALNPLVIIEAIVSAHNDMVMMGLGLLAIALYGSKNKVLSFFILALSIAIKIMSLFLIPAFLMRWNRTIALLGMVIGLGLFLMQREIMAWYLLWIIPIIALHPTKWNLVILSGGISLGVLLRYAPFFYYGHWNDPVPTMKMWVTVIPIIIAAFISLVRCIYLKRNIRFFFE